MNNNIVRIVGTVTNEFAFDHSTKGEDFYTTYVATCRTSGVYDILPVVVSERILSSMQIMQGMRVEIEGSLRSYNTRNIDGKSILKLFIFADYFDITEKVNDENLITINGYICKQPICRETPGGRKICDVCLAVNRNISIKSDYLPVLAWSKNADYLSLHNVGDTVVVKGRIQSREYDKKIGDTIERRIAYEVSASWVKAYKVDDRSGNDGSNQGKASIL